MLTRIPYRGVAEYCLCVVSENTRLAAKPGTVIEPTHHFRRRRSFE
jgi:hypothetical protein